jgi:DNA polymerase-3 subunit alpha
MPAMPFVHLRVHTEFSVVDGTLRVDEAVAAAAAAGQGALAITDLSNLFGAIKFYSAALVRRREADHRRRGLPRARGQRAAAEPPGAAGAEPRATSLLRAAVSARLARQRRARPCARQVAGWPSAMPG